MTKMTNHTSREGIRLLEWCRVTVSDGILSYIKAQDGLERHFSIPYANVSALLLGQGTSITNEAAKLLADEGTMIAFVGSSGTPLFMGSMSEYRPTEYAQDWFRIFNEEKYRLAAAKLMQVKRVEFTNNSMKGKDVAEPLIKLGEKYLDRIEGVKNQEGILLAEAQYAKSIYSLYSRDLGTTFTREHRGIDTKNKGVTSVNYYCYGFAACCLWSLGIPSSLAILHGKKRRGGLTFDLADVVKCGIPLYYSLENHHLSGKSEFKLGACEVIDRSKSFKYMFEVMKLIIDSYKSGAFEG